MDNLVTRFVVLVIAIVLTGCTGTGPKAASPPTATASAIASSPGSVEDGRILFVIESGRDVSLAYLDPDGVQEIPLDDDPSFAHAVWINPDHVAFDSKRAGKRHVFVLAIGDGSVRTLSDEDAAQSYPAVGLDGMIAYDAWVPSNGQDLGIHLDARDGRGATPITPQGAVGDPGGATQATFSPDGRWIAFIKMQDWGTGEGAIAIARTDGSQVRVLTSVLPHVDSPAWSPDGTKILFSRADDGGIPGTALWTVPIAGGEPTAITPDDRAQSRFEADWSPDGTQIVFKYFEPGMDGNELRIIDADGSNERILWTGKGEFAETPDWGR